MAESELFIQIESFVRGYHAYMDIWNPVVGEEFPLKRKPENAIDEYAVAVVNDFHIVGHVPRLLSPIIFHFLARPCNRGLAEITGNKINRGAGYELEIPCVFRFYGSSKYFVSDITEINMHVRITECTGVRIFQVIDVHKYSNKDLRT